MTIKNKTKNLMRALLLSLGVFCINAVNACTVNINAGYGLNGHVSFKASSTGVIYVPQFTWNPGDGSGNTYKVNDSTYSHTYTANGTYRVAVELQVDSTTCISYDTISINVTNVTVPCALSASFSYTVNAGGAVTFTSTSTGTYAGTQYYWNAGDGSPTTKATSTYNHTYVYQGNYLVFLYIRDTGSAYCNDSIAEYINVPTADSNECHLRANFSYTIGVNGHVTFNNTSTGFITYMTSDWNFGDGNSASVSNNTYNYTYTANGTYTVTLTAVISDSGSCRDSLSKVITITNVTTPCSLNASFAITNDTTLGLVHLASTSTGTNGGTQYYWNQNGTDVLGGSSINLNYPSNGTYNVWLIIKDTGSAYCVDSIQESLNISNRDSLHSSFVITSSSDTAGHYDYYYTSTSTGVNGNTVYAWEPGDTTAGDTGIGMTTYQHFYKYPGTHTVTLSIWFQNYPIIGHTSGGSNSTGRDAGIIFYQLSTYKMIVDIGKPAGIANITNTNTEFRLFPNPNNGTFKVVINGIEGSQDARLEITNLLGEVVYQTATHSVNGRIQQDVNLQNISAGTYFVRIITANKVYNTKTMINR